MGRRALLQRSGLLRVQRSREAVSGRHVVRLLPRRSESRQAARRPGEPGVGEPQFQRRCAVLVGGSHLRLEGREGSRQLFLPAVPQLAPRHARHVDRVDRQHQQPADDERGLLSGPPDGPGEEVGPRDDCGWRSRQPAVQRLRSPIGPARAVLRGTCHDVDPARPQGRIGFRRRSRGAEPRLHQHRPVQRGVAAALPADPRRPADLADQDLRRAPELGLLGSDRDADASHGEVLPGEHRSASPEGRARRPQSSHHGRRHHAAGKDGVRRHLRALPLE